MKYYERDLRTQWRLFTGNRVARQFLTSWGLERAAVWIISIVVSVDYFLRTDSIASVAWLLLVFVLARSLLVTFWPGERSSAVPVIVALLVGRLAATVVLATGSGSLRLGWALVLVGVVAATTGILDRSYHQLIPASISYRNIPVLGRTLNSVEGAAAIIGPLLAGSLILLWSGGVALMLACLLLAVALVATIGWMTAEGAAEPVLPTTSNAPARLLERLRPYRGLRVVIAGLLGVAAIGMVLRVALVDVVLNRLDFADGYYGLLLALLGVGALIGPVPIDKLLGHLDVELVYLGGIIALVIGAVIATLGGHIVLIVPILLMAGIAIVTLDLAASVAVRRMVREDDLPVADTVMLRAVIVGQVLALLGVAALAAWWSVAATVVILGGLISTLVLASFVSGGGPLAVSHLIATSRGRVDPRRDTSR